RSESAGGATSCGAADALGSRPSPYCTTPGNIDNGRRDATAFASFVGAVLSRERTGRQQARAVPRQELANAASSRRARERLEVFRCSGTVRLMFRLIERTGI